MSSVMAALRLGMATVEELGDLILRYHKGRLELYEPGASGCGVYVDFVNGPVGYRRRSGHDRRQPLALAIGRRRGPMTVVDATAGLARDSFLLACLGCRVIAVERSPVLGELIHDGLARASADAGPRLEQVLSRISLIVADARDALGEMTDESAPDVVYLDPMYPPTRKSALAGKEMRICRRLVGDDGDCGALFAAALRSARRRVVVKRRRHAQPLGPNPTRTYDGTSVRYDVYLTKARRHGETPAFGGA